MKILLISGFLGAGKTCFIKAMAKAVGRQFVIVENEFGEVGLDGPLLRSEQGSPDGENGVNQQDMRIWELSEGCICCSLNLDFSHSVLTIANTLDPDYLLVEPSGVALPGRVLENLRKISYERIQLLAPVTIIDGQHYAKSKKDFPEFFEDQITHTGTIVISKSEHFSSADFDRLRNELKPAADVTFPQKHYSLWTEEEWWELLNREPVWEDDTHRALPVKSQRRFAIRQKKRRAPEPMEQLSFSQLRFKHPAQLIHALECLMSPCCGRIVRCKGYFNCGPEAVRFDWVDGQYSLTGCPAMPDSRAVIIGKHLNRELIMELLPGQVSSAGKTSEV